MCIRDRPYALAAKFAHPDRPVIGLSLIHIFMPRGSKDKYSDKQKRKAEHIEDSYKERGVAPDEAEARAWRCV